MVHARTFSFTDNAINVAFPNTSLSRRNVTTQPLTAPQSSDPALLLFQLRRAQSFWYQELYQSHSAIPLPQPTEFVWQMCYEMREWGNSLPSDLPPPIREMFEQELRYSYVYCIAPSARVPQICDYHRTVIFEYAVTYLNTMHGVVQGGLNGAFYTYHDALKVYFMANQLLAVLYDAEHLILSGAPVPIPMPRPGGPPPPPVPRYIVSQGHVDNLRRSLDCLERVYQTLGKFGERWDESAIWMRSFDEISRETVERLRMLRNVAIDQHQQRQFQNGGPMSSTSQGQQQQQARQVRWVGVDVAQMLQGRGPQ